MYPLDLLVLRERLMGLDPEMGSGFLHDGLHRPAHDDPLQDLRWRRLEVGTAERGHAPFPVGSTHAP